jgi:hypothetical protein
MFRFNRPLLALAFGMMVPVCSHAADYCVKVNGGFGNGGTSFVGKGFSVPTAGLCKAWAGYLKTASSVIAQSTGSGCVSNDGKVLTLTILSTDPSFLGSGVTAVDHIRLCPGGISGCPIGGGQDQGTFGGPAAKQSCTTSVLNLPAIHD